MRGDPFGRPGYCSRRKRRILSSLIGRKCLALPVRSGSLASTAVGSGVDGTVMGEVSDASSQEGFLSYVDRLSEPTRVAQSPSFIQRRAVLK